MGDFYRTSYVKPGRDGRRPRLAVTYEDMDGRRHEKTRAAEPKRMSALRREAEEWRAELNRQWEADRERRKAEEEAARRPSLADYLRDFVKDRLVEGIERSTELNYSHIVDKILAPGGGLARLRVDEVTPGRCRAWQRHLLGDRGLCAESVSLALSFLKTALNRAEEDGVIDTNPIAKVKGPKVPKRKPNALDRQSASKVKAWVREGGGWMRCAVALALHSGMRRGEVCALRWNDVDMERGVIHVRHAIGTGRDGTYLKDPKNHQTRKFGMSGDLAVAVARRRAEVMEMLANAYSEDIAWRLLGGLYVCGDLDGSWREPSVVSATWERLRDELKLNGTQRERCTFHDLRHTFITYMVLGGVPLPALMPIVGHSSASMTLDVYASVDEQAIAEAVARIDYLLPDGEWEPDEPAYILPSPAQ